MFAITTVEATLLAAVIGGATGIIAGAVTQGVRFRLERRARSEERSLADLRELQDALARLNRLFILVQRPANDGDTWEDYTATRGEALKLNERVLDDDLRETVRTYRVLVAAHYYEETERVRHRELVSAKYDEVQEALGVSIRKKSD
jgi:cation transport regulator ChaC